MPTTKTKVSKPAAGKRLNSAAAKAKTLLLVATRKGAWIYRGDTSRRTWTPSGPHFLGHIINHMVLDPRDRRTLLAAAKTGHLGPTVFRSTNFGKTWKEAAKPPAFASSPEGMRSRSVDHTFWLTTAHANEPDVWYAGTSPQGLFRSEDGGVTWAPFSAFHDDPTFRNWFGGEQDGTPDGPKLHSILIDPRDPAYLYFAMSGGGVHESTDKGKTWTSLVAGLEVVEGFDARNMAFHDPHCIRMCPSNPDRLWQQNHCGIYRLDRPATEWVRVGKSMPKKVGDVGLPLAIHPRDADTAWVFPMDGSGVWPRTCPDGIPGAFVTRNGGKTWKRQAAGMPETNTWWTVKRQALATDAAAPLGVYFGTTSGELWGSRDEGENWRVLARHLPEIYAVETAQVE